MRSLKRACALLLPCMLFISLIHQKASANACVSEADQGLGSWEASTLPKVIGNPKSFHAKTPFQMTCDTMYVHAGDTTTVYQGSLLHFPPDQFKNRIIRVKGTLKLLGDKGLPVFMAGSKKENPTGVVPGDEKWGGLRLDTSGALLVRHTDFVNADTVLYLRSKRHAFKDAYFEKCGMYILPDKTLKVLDDREYLSIPDVAGIFSTPKPEGKRSKTPWLWAGAGTGIVVAGVAGAVWLFNSGEDGGTNPIPPNPSGSSLKPAPDFPGKPDPR